MPENKKHYQVNSMRILLLLAILHTENSMLGQTNAVPALTEKQIKFARESVLISNRQLKLDAYLSVDDKPADPATGPRSTAVVYIKSVNKTAIPASTVADAIWVMGEDKTWSAWLPETSSLPAYVTSDKIDRMVSGHPFSPKEVVDVIVRLTYDDKAYFLKAKEVVVSRTE
jgi:hypothetical protein